MDYKQFKAARLKLGMTQGELGAYLGLHRLTVLHYEQGTRRIPGPVSLALSLALTEKAREVTGESGPQHP